MFLRIQKGFNQANLITYLRKKVETTRFLITKRHKEVESMLEIMFRRIWVGLGCSIKNLVTRTILWFEKNFLEPFLMVCLIFLVCICAIESLILGYWFLHLTGFAEALISKNPEYIWLIKSGYLNNLALSVALLNTPVLGLFFVEFIRLCRKRPHYWYKNTIKALDIITFHRFPFMLVMAILFLNFPAVVLLLLISLCLRGLGLVWYGIQRIIGLPEVIRQKNQKFLEDNPEEMARFLNKKIPTSSQSHHSNRL